MSAPKTKEAVFDDLILGRIYRHLCRVWLHVETKPGTRQERPTQGHAYWMVGATGDNLEG